MITKLPTRIDETLSLDGIWRFCATEDRTEFSRTELDDSTWPEMSLPNNWHLAGLDHAGVVWFRRTVDVPAELEGRRFWLRFEGVDYFAEVWFNGRRVGKHEGYFQPFEFDVTDLVQPGETHVVAVRVDSPNEEYGTVWHMRKTLIKGIFGHHDCRPGGGWGPRGQEQNTGGIWNSVKLVSRGTARITSARVTSEIEDGHKRAIVHVDVTVGCTGASARKVEVRGTVSPILSTVGERETNPQGGLRLRRIDGYSTDQVTVSAEVWLKPGDNQVRLSAVIEEPRLWWTWDHGEPSLYEAAVSLDSGNERLDQRVETFGIRSISKDEDWNWYLNGRRIFLRGSNYIPTQWLANMDAERFGWDVELMREANLNTIRVHAHVTRDEFYRAADEAGILVWQDFPLQWGYADTEEFARNALRQQDEMIELLFNHPSIFVWCSHNESPWDAPWLQYKVPDWVAGQNKALDERLAAAAQRQDPSRVVHMSSGSGDGHPYPGWFHSKSFWDFKDLPGAPFVTEYGAQALPNLETLQGMFSADELWPPKLEAWEFHNFQPKENEEFAGVPLGNSLEDFVANSQDYQARLIQFATESYRRAKHQPVTGVFQFMFVDPWPAITWAVLDVHREPKQGFDALRRSMQPVLPSAAVEKDRFAAGERVALGLWVVNDLPHVYPEATLGWRLMPNTLMRGHVTVAVGPDSSVEVASLDLGDALPAGAYALELWVDDGEGHRLGENEFRFVVEKTPSGPPIERVKSEG